MTRNALIGGAALCSIVGAGSAIASILVLDITHKEEDSPVDVLDSEAITVAVVSLGLIGTLITGVRWLYYRIING